MNSYDSELAEIYQELYDNFFNFRREFEFYNSILQKHKKKKLLEIGCGTGRLAQYFIKEGFLYTGSDVSQETLEKAKARMPKGTFIKTDMRNLGITEAFDSILVSGRIFSYMVTNRDVFQALESMHRALLPRGIVVIDNFDARDIFMNFKEKFTQTYTIHGRTITQVNSKSMNLSTGWTWDWEAQYYIDEKGRSQRILQDTSTLRAFTVNELKLFFELIGFTFIESFPDEDLRDGCFTIVAQKNGLVKITALPE